jgi:hypothetical protein
MARNENPPFPRGETFFNGGTVDATSGAHLEGTEWTFEDLDLSQSGVKPQRTNLPVVCKIVRNTSGVALEPKRLCRFELTAGNDCGGQVDGYVTTTAAKVDGVIDEWLPTAGCPANDLCWVVVEGPTQVLTALSNRSADTAVGGIVIAITAATSQCTTAGRIDNQDLTGATALLAAQVQNRIGYAMSLVTTASTNTSCLINKYRW